MKHLETSAETIVEKFLEIDALFSVFVIDSHPLQDGWIIQGLGQTEQVDQLYCRNQRKTCSYW